MLDKNTLKELLSPVLGDQLSKWYESDQLQDSNIEISDSEVKVCDMDQISKTIFHMLHFRKDSMPGAENNLKQSEKTSEQWSGNASRYSRVNAEYDILEALLVFELKKQAVLAGFPLVDVVDGNIVHKEFFVRKGHIIATKK